ncbi:response regulator transcription factor [Bifidobacterium sp. MA2]|uniref:Response regulator transcription factor n=1 Tax=Bifidobacterium santillanense TaxID=2809028 RepID=A0ABS5UR65_9BIFI|nr:response regulator [Bifidobacterium santillanense]MBT1173399.1 response regulator transcription factor [Bifidobacterium santillanense]
MTQRYTDFRDRTDGSSDACGRESSHAADGTAPARPIALAIVDNDVLALSALADYLRTVLPNVDVLWSVESAAAALRRLRSGRSDAIPDVMLIDMSMPGMDGPALIRTIRERDGRMTLLAMTSFPLDMYARAAAEAGAQGIVAKRDPRGIAAAIRRIRAARGIGPRASAGADTGRSPTTSSTVSVTFGSPKAAFERLAASGPQGLERLTDIENTIIGMCRRGMTSTEIGAELGMAAPTVDTHLKRACAKAGARNRVQLVAMWVEANGMGRRTA